MGLTFDITPQLAHEAEKTLRRIDRLYKHKLSKSEYKKNRSSYIKKHYKKFDIDLLTKINHSPTTVGALHEYIVVCDLVRRGLNVFRSVSANCACDLILMTEEGYLFRVEVKTISKNKKGKLHKNPPIYNNGHKKHDILAIVAPDKIYYYATKKIMKRLTIS